MKWPWQRSPSVQLAETPSTTEIGFSGVKRYWGLVDEEYNTDLKGIKAINTYRKMALSDAQVRAVERCMTLPLRRGTWIVEPAEDQPRSEAIAQFVSDNLMGSPPDGMELNWETFLQAVTLNVRYGVTLFEKVWEEREGKLRIRKLAPRHIRTILEHPKGGWIWDAKGALQGIKQYQWIDGRAVEAVIPIEKLLIFTNDPEEGNVEGFSCFRPMYKHWHIKDTLYRIQAVGLEKQAVGTPVGKAPGGIGPEAFTKFETLIRSYAVHEQMGMVIPDTYTLELLEGKLKGEEMAKAIEHHDLQIARSGLAQFINLGSSNVGSYALSADQLSFFLFALEAYANAICNTINTHLIPELVAYNFGEQKRYPQLICSRIATRDLKSYADTLKALVDAKLLTPERSFEEWLRQDMDLPKLPDEVEAAGERKPEPFAPFGQPAEGATEETSDNTNGAAAAAKPQHMSSGTEGDRRPFALAEPKWRRELTRFERHVAFDEYQRRYGTAEEKLTKRLDGRVREMVAKMVPQWQAALDLGNLTILSAIAAEGTGAYSQTIRSILGEMVDWAKKQAWQEVGRPGKLPPNPAAIADWLMAKSKTITDLHIADIQSRAAFAGMAAYNQGKTTTQVLDVMKDAVGEWAERDLKATASLSVAEAVNYGRDIVRREADLQGAQFSAILDDATCELCEDLDGMQVHIGAGEIDEFEPPLHDNCRCMWVWVGKEEEDFEETFERPSDDLIDRHMKYSEVHDALQPR